MKKALVTGINKYITPHMNLRGCVNDALLMVEILINYFGFKQENIILLLDEHATKMNILRMLEGMILSSSELDKLAFFQSSHGSFVKDVSGDEDDRYDEILCPYDMDWNTETYILDDNLYNIFQLLPQGASMTVFLDSCFSGGATKEAPGRSLAKFMFPPSFSKAAYKNAKLNRIGQKTINPLFTSFSACGERQYSTEDYIDGAYRGAFTYHFCQAIKEFGSLTPKRKLVAKTRKVLKKNKYRQLPRVVCENKIKRTSLFAD